MAELGGRALESRPQLTGKISFAPLCYSHGRHTRKSGPPGNQNAFRHGLAAAHNRRAEGDLTENERDIRTEILAGLIADSGGEPQISTATRILAEIIGSTESRPTLARENRRGNYPKSRSGVTTSIEGGGRF